MVDRIVSSDSHINEPPDLWTRAASGDLAERMPRVVEIEAGDAWIVAPGAALRPVGTSAVAGTKPEDYMKEPVTYKKMRPGSFDPEARLEDMSIDSVEAEVLYPGIARGLARFADAEVRLFCTQVYNDWIAEFQSAEPSRLVGLAVLPPLDDGDNALHELERAVGIGLKGALLSITQNGRPLTHPEAEPLWAFAAEHGVPISLHVGNVSRNLLTASDADVVGVKEAYLTSTPLNISDHIAMLIFSGLFEKYADLKIVIAEAGIGWLPYLLSRMESVYDRHRHYLESRISVRPTELFHRHMYATFQEDVPGLRLRDLVGVDNIMWASDYPHTDTTWPHSVDVVKRDFADVPDDETFKITVQNCVDLYDIH